MLMIVVDDLRPFRVVVGRGWGAKLSGPSQSKEPHHESYEILRYGFLLLRLAGAKVN